MNDDLVYKINCNIQAKIAEKQEEVIMQTIQEIGGDKFCEITFDRNKVIEALTMYKNKDKYAEVVHGEWKHREEPLGWRDVDVAMCSECHKDWVLDEWDIKEFAEYHRYCPNCGAKMRGV